MEDGNIKEPSISYDKIYTYSDYLKFEFDYMVELIRGRIYKMIPGPNLRHQSLSSNLFIQMAPFFLDRSCRLFSAPTDVILPIENRRNGNEHTVVQPDLCIFCDLSVLKERGAFGPPTLVIEILSPHTKKKDLQLKYDIYEEAGVQEYWIVMPKEELIEQFVLVESKYDRKGTFTTEDRIKSVAVIGLEVELAAVFEL